MCMESAFFCCHNLGMDIDKLCKMVMKNEDLHGIPIIHIFKVIRCVLEAIGTGECFYELHND